MPSAPAGAYLGARLPPSSEPLPMLGTVSLVRSSLNDLKPFKDRLRDKELSLNAAK